MVIAKNNSLQETRITSLFHEHKSLAKKKKIAKGTEGQQTTKKKKPQPLHFTG